jgi:Phr family secreted Rap phosphatase inhibitor
MMKKLTAAMLSAATLLILSVGASFATTKSNCCNGAKCCPSGACCRSHLHTK